MARVTVHYTKYGSSKLATVFSFLGGSLFTLCVAPGVILFAVSVVRLVMSGFSDGETWTMLLSSLVVAAVGFGIGLVLNLLFEKIARSIALHKAKKNVRGSQQTAR